MPSHAGRRRWIWVIAALAVIGLGAVVALHLTSRGLSQWVRDRVIRKLQQHYNADVQLQDLDVALFPHARIEGKGLTLRERGRPDAPPLITLNRLIATTSMPELLRDPPHFRRVELDGLHIQISRRGRSESQERKSGPKTPDFVIDSIDADGTRLTVIPRNETKPSLEFDIRRLRLSGAGPSQAMSFQATLRNAEPPGDIQTTGKFGPWEKGDPGGTPVMGRYTFRDANLAVFRGIAGMLASDGNYHGQLDRIEVDGQTDVPDFTVKISGKPVHLKTTFHAIVDGTDGDTQLQPVDAHFGTSRVVARGSVEGRQGVPGKTVALNVDATGRLEDMLRLGEKGAQPPMRGAIRFQTKLVIPPGKVDIDQKLQLDGTFRIDNARFSKAELQQKINDLSHRGKGKPKEPKTDLVVSDFAGRFSLDHGTMAFRRLSFCIPGVTVNLHGRYGLTSEQLDFHGVAKLEAELSDTTTGIKSLLLEIIDPLFKRGKSGAVIPIKITGGREHPEIGLDRL